MCISSVSLVCTNAWICLVYFQFYFFGFLSLSVIWPLSRYSDKHGYSSCTRHYLVKTMFVTFVQKRFEMRVVLRSREYIIIWQYFSSSGSYRTLFRFRVQITRQPVDIKTKTSIWIIDLNQFIQHNNIKKGRIIV